MSCITSCEISSGIVIGYVVYVLTGLGLGSQGKKGYEFGLGLGG